MSWFSQAVQPVQSEKEAFWYLNLTLEQHDAYEKLYAHLKQSQAVHVGHDDRHTLLRFLKARQWDVQRAATMYQNMAKWRLEQRTDQMYKTFTFPEKEEVLRHYPHFYHNTDKYGRPVYIELLGKTDAARLLEATTLERLLHYHICDWENLVRRIMPACSLLAGRPVITKSVILDLKGVSMKTFGAAAQKILRTVVAIDQDYYCELLGQMFIVNTPTVFRLIWAAVNPLLEERTRRKIVILGSDFLPTLTQMVPLDNLPTFLGGSSAVPDNLASVGPWTEVQMPMAEEDNESGEHLHKAEADCLQDCGGEGSLVTVKACAISGSPLLRQSATAPGRLHLEESEEGDGKWS